MEITNWKIPLPPKAFKVWVVNGISVDVSGREPDAIFVARINGYDDLRDRLKALRACNPEWGRCFVVEDPRGKQTDIGLRMDE